MWCFIIYNIGWLLSGNKIWQGGSILIDGLTVASMKATNHIVIKWL